ncbi:MAG: iron uptake porin [Cyanobacteria bacterium]|nr:iron uptake porin [Cyanobacteriota bacterium]MDW8201148.1 iron uptake porin [Cyanobacteriota bacterium SKYGB_h_bin112]
MNKILWHSLVAAPALLGISLLSSSALANPADSSSTLTQIRSYGRQDGGQATSDIMRQVRSYGSDDSVGQVTSVTQLSDVQPTDWAYQSLQSLVERYGCIVGYPDGTFRGNRPLSRFEFAAGLNACMDKVNDLIAQGLAGVATKSDIETLKRLQEEFRAELDAIRERIDVIDDKVATLEAQQFSTNTKLGGEVLFVISGVIDGDDIQSAANPVGTSAAGPRPALAAGTRVGENVTFTSQVRLAFDTSFTGRDRLRTRIQYRNIGTGTLGTVNNAATNGSNTGTNMTQLGSTGTSNNGTDFEIDDLAYRFPALGSGRITIAARSEFDRIYDTLSPFEGTGTGSISRFGRFNPIYRSTTGAGAVLEYTFAPWVSATVGYLAANAAAQNPAVSAGLFDGQFTALAQVTFRPVSNLKIAALYGRSYYPAGAGVTGATGSVVANNPLGGIRTNVDEYSINAQWDISSQLVLSGWFGYEQASATTGASRADIINWAVQFGARDLFNRGDLAGIIFGQPPQRTGGTFGPEGNTTSYHIEAFYRYQLNDNIQITPGIIIITNPEHNTNNDTQYVGIIRTRFSF